MKGEKKSVGRICELAAKEQDPDKLSEPIAKIDRMLQEKQDGLRRESAKK